MNWKEFFNSRKIEIILTVVFLVIILIVLSNFLEYIEQRNGVILPDPILNIFNPIDLTWLIFGLIYASIIIAIIDLTKEPNQLLLAIQSYSLLIMFRLMVMYVTPLNAPAKLLFLNDPVVQFFGSGQILTKDLFFSGHTATLFLLFLIVNKRILKIFFLFSTIIIGAAVILQHVHYTVDVLTAPFFSYSAYRIVSIINEFIPVNGSVHGKD
ncbi:MAG: phosphatase PAP2-related protein [Ignavibacteriaceae bacterium]